MMNFKRDTGLRKKITAVESQEPPTLVGIDRKAKIHNLYGVIENVAWIWRLLGIFPFTIKYSMSDKGYGLNKFYGVYGVFLCSACSLTFTMSIVYLHEWLKDRIGIEHVTIFVRTVASLMCLFLVSIWRVIRYKEVTESIEMMISQDSLLEKLGCQLDNESNAKIIRIYVWASLITVTIFVAYDFYATVKVMESVTIQWIFWIFPLIAQVMDLTILVTMVGLLGFRFRALNEKITAIVKRANAASPKVLVTSDVCAHNLQLVTKAHYNICAVGKRINGVFDWNVIINVITAFIILSTTLYYIFVEVQRDTETDFVRIGTYIHWEFIHSVPIIIIVVVCNWTTNQSIHTGKLIHEIRLLKSDTRLYEAVKSFSLQLHHQKLEFTAAGFFPLNSTLLQTMVGNITTYLVILIQFQPRL